MKLIGQTKDTHLNYEQMPHFFSTLDVIMEKLMQMEKIR